MKRQNLAVCLTGAAMLTLFAGPITAADKGYAGTWLLDRQASKGLPTRLKAYDMVVTQDGQQLMVTTRTEGEATVGEQGSRTSEDAAALLMAQASMGPKTTGLIMTGSAGTMGDSTVSNGSLAFLTVLPQVIYTLNGKKTTSTLAGLGTATLSAKPGKNGKFLDLSMTHQESAGGQLMTALAAKERWTLSDDGKVLKVLRTVSTQQTSETVNLTFRRASPTP